MTKAGDGKSGDKAKTGERAGRLAEALRANLRRRKEAARSSMDEREDEAAGSGGVSEDDK